MTFGRLSRVDALDTADLLDRLPAPVLLADANGRVERWNPAATATFGGRDLAGALIVDLLPGEPSRAEAAQSWHTTLTRRDAGQAVEVVVSTTAAAGGRRLFVLHNISHHRELNRLRERLLQNLAHELRGHVTVIHNVLEVIDEQANTLTTDELRAWAAKGRSATMRLRSLVGGLLSAGAMQSGRFVVTPRPVPLPDLVREAVHEVAPMLEQRGQIVLCDGLNLDLVVAADGDHVTRVLVNLLSNAAKYSPDGVAIRVAAGRRGGCAWLQVQDSGPGIAAEQQRELFTRFFRARPDGQTPGVGLGLAIAKSIIDAHGGTVTVESAPGEGTCVEVTLPLAEPWRRAGR
ncbi:MAG: HAMP domain-containing sensor histidine kinase [Dehalococcoidia bacterium]